MNLQHMIRTQVLIAGVGLAFFSVGGARAQEITNAQFADGPYTEAFTQPAPANPGTVVSTDFQAAKTQAVDNPSGNEPTKKSHLAEGIMWIGVALIWAFVALSIYFASLVTPLGPRLPSVASSQFNIKLD